MAKYIKGIPDWYSGETKDLNYQEPVKKVYDNDIQKKMYEDMENYKNNYASWQTPKIVKTPPRTTPSEPLDYTLSYNKTAEEKVAPKKSSLLTPLLAPFSKENYNQASKDILGFLRPKLQQATTQKGNSAVIGAINSIGLGLPKVATEKLVGGQNTAYSQAQQNNPKSYLVGEMAGYLAPGIGATKALKPVTGALTKNISSALGKQVIEGAIVGAGLDTTQGLIEGDNAKQLATRVGTGALLGAGSDVGLNALGKYVPKALKALDNSAFKTTVTESKIQPINAQGQTFKSNGQLIRKEGLQALPSPRDYTQKINELPSSNDVIPMGGYKETSRPLVQIKKERIQADIPINQRDFSNVGNKEVKSIQYNHQELKPYIQQEAELLKGELLNGNQGTPYQIKDNGIISSGGRNSKVMSDSIQAIQDITGASYEKIEKAIDDLIIDGGRENNALAKKVELIIDERLSNGYDDAYVGDIIPPNIDYLNRKEMITGQPLYKNTVNSGMQTNKTPVQLPNKPQESVKSNLDINSQAVQNNAPMTANEAIKPSVGATDRTQSYVMLKSSKNENKRNFNQLLNDFYTRTVDINNPLKNINDKTYTLATNSKKAGGSVSHILENSLVDRQGNKIGESLKSIATDIPKNKENDFMYYVLHKHNIDRTAQGKPILPDFDSNQSAKAAALLEQESPEFKEVGERLVKFLNQFEDEWGNKSGLISDDLWQNLQDTYKNYIPTNRSFDELEQGISSTQGRGFVNQNTPLNKATGSARDVINPIENIMRLVDRTVRTARYNEVGQSFVQALRKNPALAEYAEIIPSSVEINPNVKNIVTVLEGGEPINVQVNDKRLLEALQGLYKSKDLNAIEKGAKAFNGVFKALITTKNPVFAIRNIMRDLPTGYVNSKEKNPVKYLADWLVATKDLVTDAPIAQKYRGLGGESANFLNTNKLYKSADDIMGRKLITDKEGFITGSKQKNVLFKGLKWAGDKVEALNSATESAPRLAEFKRIYQKTGDVQKALYEAGEVTTNFSRGGDLTKWADIFIPYLNAGVQGLDKLARQMDPRNPKQFLGTLVKGGIGIGAPTLALHYMNMDNPYYTELDNRTKDNYFLIPNGFGEKDEDGIPKTFIKIPKSREYGVLFSSLFQRIQRASQGEKDAFKGFGDYAKTNFSPSNPFENNLASPLMNLKGNKDFAGRDIVPRAMLNDERSKYLQYDEKTSEVTKQIAATAKKAGIDLSPKQLDYLIRSYSGIIGQVGLPATTKSTMQSGNQLQKTLKPVTTQFVSDPLYSNQAITDFYDNLQKAKNKASDNNLLNNVPSKTVTSEESLRNKLNKIQTQMSDLNKEIILADQKNDQDRIKELRARMLNLAKEGNKIYKSK